MPPRKDKVEKLGKAVGEDGSAMILNYLLMVRVRAGQQNRPYSAIDISSNLHNRVTKAYAAKALKEMHEKKLVEGKAAGKQLVYHAIQDSEDEATPEQLAEIDQEIEGLKEQIASTQLQEKGLRTELAVLSARVPTAELRDQVQSLKLQKEGLVDQLTPLRNASGSTRTVSVEEQRRVDKAWKRWQKTATARKRICRDLWDKCSEVLPEDMASKKELWESLGLEGEL